MKIITFAVTILLIATNAPYHLFGQSSVIFEVSFEGGSNVFQKSAPIPLKLTLKNIDSSEEEYYPFYSKALKTFNYWYVSASFSKVAGEEKTVQQIDRFGDSDEVWPQILTPGDSIQEYSNIIFYCNMQDCLDEAGQYVLYVEYLLNNKPYDVILSDSIRFIIEEYQGVDKEAYSFLKEKSTAPVNLVFITQMSKNYSSSIFSLYPELVSVYETFAEKYQDSQFYPWILLHLGYLYASEKHCVKIGRKPNFERSRAISKLLLEKYENDELIRKRVIELNSYRVFSYKEWKRNQK